MPFTGCVMKDFLWDVFLKLCVWIRCKIRQESPFKMIFIKYSMEPYGFLVFFFTLRSQRMRRRWRWRRTRRSFPSLLFTFLLTSLLYSFNWRTRVGNLRRHFLVFYFLRDLPSFWSRILLGNVCFIFEQRQLFSSFSWLLLLLWTFLRLTSAIF